MSTLSIDFETASTVDLRRTGLTRYVHDPLTRILCMAWAFDDEPVQIWTPDQDFPVRIADHVVAGGIVAGWNVAFEQEVWNAVLFNGVRVPFLVAGQLSDTMARAAYWGLPMSLDAAGAALRIKHQKDRAGHALMLRMCRPRTTTPLTWWHETDPVKFQELQDYCVRDVEAEREIASKIPSLPDREKRIWHMDRQMNRRGVAVDEVLVQELQRVVTVAQGDLILDLIKITDNKITSPSATVQLLAWAKANGYAEDNLRRETILGVLKTLDPSTPLARVLACRLAFAKASTAKLEVLDTARCFGRIHNMTQYYGASRTGRWAGRLFQPQNLPRGSTKNLPAIIKAIRDGAHAGNVDLLSNTDPMTTASSCLRGCLVPGPAHAFACADLSQIEARVVAWLAGQEDLLDVFRRGEDVYVYAAARSGSTNRTYGKVQVLALGFGMGWQKFQVTAKTYGIVLTDKEALDGVVAWRTANRDIVSLWYDSDAAARRIATAPDKTCVKVGDWLEFWKIKKHMLVKLPSGRALVYRNIALEYDVDTGNETLVYDGVNQITKQWGRCRTYGGKLVENITQAVARDVMADAMLDIDRLPDTHLVLSVHDEVVCEVGGTNKYDRLDDILRIMRTTPAWAPGLPVNAEGWVGDRYRK